MKKLLALLLALVMMFSLAACGEQFDEDEIAEFEENERLVKEYKQLIKLLENEEYEQAMYYVEGLYNDYMNSQIEQGVIEDPELVEKYENLMRYIENLATGYADEPWYFSFSYHDENGEYIYIDGNAALAELYKQLEALGGFRDSADYLDNFQKIEGVRLESHESTTDHLGSTSDFYRKEEYRYNPDGTLSYSYNDNNILTYVYTSSATLYYFYENGKLTSIKLGSIDSPSALITPTYNAAGQIECYHLVNSSGDEYDILCTYDAAGRLIEKRRDYVNRDDDYAKSVTTYLVTYTYNAQGTLTQELRQYINSYDYVEDTKYNVDYTRVESQTSIDYILEGGKPVAKTETYTDFDREYDSETDTYNQVIYRTYTHESVLTCDEEGRIIQEETTYGKTYDAEGKEVDKPSHVSSVRTYTYGDYWFYSVG